MTDPNWPPPAPPEYTASSSAGVNGELAGWGSRAGALIVDAVILIVLALVLGAIIGGAAGTSDSGVAGAIIFYYVAVFLYPPLTMMRGGEHNGQTFGKQAVGIRVVRETGQPIGFGWALLRELVCKGVLSLFTIPIILSYLWPLWDDRNQALHDKMASTLVVRA